MHGCVCLSTDDDVTLTVPSYRYSKSHIHLPTPTTHLFRLTKVDNAANVGRLIRCLLYLIDFFNTEICYGQWYPYAYCHFNTKHNVKLIIKWTENTVRVLSLLFSVISYIHSIISAFIIMVGGSPKNGLRGGVHNSAEWEDK